MKRECASGFSPELQPGTSRPNDARCYSHRPSLAHDQMGRDQRETLAQEAKASQTRSNQPVAQPTGLFKKGFVMGPNGNLKSPTALALLD